MNTRIGCVFGTAVFLLAFATPVFGQASAPTQPGQTTSSSDSSSVKQLPAAAVPLDSAKSGIVPLAPSKEVSAPSPDAGAAPADASPSEAPPPGAKTLRGGDDLRYRIGAGDVLEIRVFEHPTLSRDMVRVDASGVIRMPLVHDDIPVMCLTESEIADEIAKDYSEYLKDPQVSVFVKEFNAQPVSVVGAVQKPGGYELQRRIRLRELLMIAGGPTSAAGGVIQIMHDSSAGVCDTGGPRRMLSTEMPDATLLKVQDVMGGAPDSNPFVRAGDFINLPDADMAYVVGNVYKPSSISLTGTVTVSRAIAMAGGALPNSKGYVRVLRLTPDKTGNRELRIPLKNVEKYQTEDIALRAGDIVEVPLAQGKLILKSVFTSVASGALLYYPLTVIR